MWSFAVWRHPAARTSRYLSIRLLSLLLLQVKLLLGEWHEELHRETCHITVHHDAT